MLAESRHGQQALRAELEEARARLDGLLRELQAIDDMLEELSAERQKFALVQDACGALEKLRDLGAAEMFWGGGDAGKGDLHISNVRRSVDDFEVRLSHIESSRRGLLDRIRSEQENSEFLEDDVYEAQQEEELRKLEWVVERQGEPSATESSRSGSMKVDNFAVTLSQQSTVKPRRCWLSSPGVPAEHCSG